MLAKPARRLSSAGVAVLACVFATALPASAAVHRSRHISHHPVHHPVHHGGGIPQHNGGDRDADNNGAPSDGDGTF